MIKNPDGTVTITEKEYLALLTSSSLFECLEAGGVSNWDWYDECLSGWTEPKL